MSFTRHVSFELLWPLIPDPWPLLFLALLRPLGAVLRTSLHAAGNAHRIQRAANHVIAHARQILHTAPADQHNRVLLQVVAYAWNVGRHFNSIGQPHARHLAQCRVRFLRSLRVHAGANAALLRTSLQRRARRLVTGPLPALSHQLVKRRHSWSLLSRAT